MEDDFCLEPALTQAAAIRDRTISSRELLELYLRRLDRLNPALNAVVTLDVERAMQAATEADAATMAGLAFGAGGPGSTGTRGPAGAAGPAGSGGPADSGGPAGSGGSGDSGDSGRSGRSGARGRSVGHGGLPPLHGLPITIKDAIETAGIRSTGGARELANHVPAADAPAVARLKAAGAIVFGKTNVPRWSSDMQTYNELFGVTNNPWDRSRTPGGSSGGAAAAVAAGLTSFELGTDIGGSVRIPSSYCGVFGHKPSFGIIPQRGYLDRVGGGQTDSDINVFGPLARSAADLDLLVDILAGPNPEDAIAWRLQLPPPRHGDLASYRIGLWLDDPAAEVDAEVVKILSSAAAALTAAGAGVDDTHPAVTMPATKQLFDQLILPAVSISVPPDPGDRLSGSHRAWLELDQARAAMRRAWAEWFRRYDVLLCPVMPMPAFPHDHGGNLGDRTVTINGRPRKHADTLAWTGSIGVVYLPSTVVPVGRTADGLPVGIQVVGPYLEDRTALWIAARLAELTGGYVTPPGV